MRIPFFLIATALLGTSAWSQDKQYKQDKSPWFVELGFGAVLSENATGVPGGDVSFNPGYLAGLALGRTYSISSRVDMDVELEVFHQYFTVDAHDMLAIPSAVSDNASATAFMLNGIFDWKFTEQYALYGGLGVGWAKNIHYDAWDSGNLSLDKDSAGAIQGRFGFAYNLGGNYDVRLGYRYFKTESIDINNGITGATDTLDVAQNTIEATFRWGL